MPMGVLSAPGWFQHIMNYAMARVGVDSASAFLDNCNVQGQQTQWQLCWVDTLQVLRTLAELEFMENLRKCKFLTMNASILGLDLTEMGFMLGLKFMGNLHSVSYQLT